MTDFDRVREYYKNFDEDNRLINDNSGKLEYEMTMKNLNKYLPKTENKKKTKKSNNSQGRHRKFKRKENNNSTTKENKL